MEATKINRSSWHCKIANFGGHQNWNDTDICQYTRDFLLGVILVSGIGMGCIALYATVCAFTGAMLYDIFALIVYGASFSEIGVFGLIVWFIVTFSITVWAVSAGKIRLWPKRKYKYEEPKEPGFLKLAYRAHKEKYCFRIETVN